MTYCIVLPAELATLAFWRRLRDLDWVVCKTETVELPAESVAAILRWFASVAEHPVEALTIDHLHWFVEGFSRRLGHAVPVVGPKFLSSAVMDNPVHTRLTIDIDEPSPEAFVALLGMTDREQAAALFGPPAETTRSVLAAKQTEETLDDSRVHHRHSRARRPAKGAAAPVGQGQSDDPRTGPDNSTESATPAGSGGDSV